VTPFAALLATATEDDLRVLASALGPHLPTPDAEEYVLAAEYADRVGKSVDAVTASFRRGSLPGEKRGREVWIRVPGMGDGPGGHSDLR
jgi:hypothetical protein